MDFSRNEKNARSVASNPPRITETGEYVGKFTDAYYYKTSGGAGMVRLDFEEAGTGRTCTVSMCVQKKDGTDTFNRNILDALMVVLGLRGLFGTDTTVKHGDGARTVSRFLDVTGAPVGVLLQRENDPNNEQYPFRMNLVTPFDPRTRRIAAEILDKTEAAEMLDIKKKGLKDRTLPKKAQAAQAPAYAPAQAAAQSGYDPYANDDTNGYF